ncbi:hypothetical protein GXW82_03610 [Streptacidiphilus sp. 4-A2]|nr:hypothetical protein [Streptacidiphilus sp. 4-A2]
MNIIFGRGGAGKTALAVEVAHRLAPGYPDGQLLARLRSGTGRSPPPRYWSASCGCSGSRPGAFPRRRQRAEMYRSLLGSRRVLVVLDDVLSEQQISALLPGNPLCAVIVTSRRRLTGIPAAGGTRWGRWSGRRRWDCWRGSSGTSGSRRSRTRSPLCVGCAGICRWRCGSWRRGWPPGRTGALPLSPTGCWTTRGGSTSSTTAIWGCGPASPGPMSRCRTARAGCSGCWR